MRMTLAGLAVLASLLATDARAAQFCAYFTDGSTNCGFYTFQQCLADVSGVGGYCSQNPAYGYRSPSPYGYGSAPPPGRERRHRGWD
jgi:Protein of unknown function (DUF3551)